MKTKTFQLKEILPNPFRDFETNPLDEVIIARLQESVSKKDNETNQFWEDKTVRINADGKPELVHGHHVLAALRREYPGTQEFEWPLASLTDGQMIARMARENSARRTPGVSDIREAITAAVEAHGKGLILPKEMPIDAKTNTTVIRYAPNFAQNVSGPESGPHPYTVDALAKFLGFVKSSTQKPTNSFEAAFGAEELIADGVMKESQIKGLSAERLGELVISVRKQRDAAKAEAERQAAEVKRRAEEAARKAVELKKHQEEAEKRRLAAIEAEKLAAQKRAEEKAKRDAEEKVRREIEEKRKKAEMEQRAIAEEKRKKEEAERRAAAEIRRKEEEEKQRKIREAQQAEAKKQAEEAERQRQLALTKAKKEEDERKAAQIIRDAEAAKARAVAEAKRKEEAARQAEIAAKKKIEEDKAREIAATKKREEDEKARQAAAEKKRADDDAREAARRKAQQEAEAKKEADRAEAARLKIIADKKAADDAERKAKAELAQAEARRKEEETLAAKKKAIADAQLKATAARAAEAARTIDPSNIRGNTQRIADEEAAKAGRKVAPNPIPGGHFDREFAHRFNTPDPEDIPTQKTRQQAAIIKLAKEWIELQYKQAAKKAHPDHGGTQEEMQLVNATVAWLRRIIEENKI